MYNQMEYVFSFRELFELIAAALILGGLIWQSRQTAKSVEVAHKRIDTLEELLVSKVDGVKDAIQDAAREFSSSQQAIRDTMLDHHWRIRLLEDRREDTE
jgi:hypothetical protein